MAEDWVKGARSEARAAFDARFEVEVELGALKKKIQTGRATEGSN